MPEGGEGGDERESDATAGKEGKTKDGRRVQ